MIDLIDIISCHEHYFDEWEVLHTVVQLDGFAPAANTSIALIQISYAIARCKRSWDQLFELKVEGQPD